MRPLLASYPDDGVYQFIQWIARRSSSAKEAIMATQETVEHLQLDPDAEEAVDDGLALVCSPLRPLV